MIVAADGQALFDGVGMPADATMNYPSNKRQHPTDLPNTVREVQPCIRPAPRQ
jgi:hypothetical protein